MKKWLFLIAIYTSCVLASCNNPKEVIEEIEIEPQSQEMILGTYAIPPRYENGRVNMTKLIAQLTELNANTYNWLIWQYDKDWDDLHYFLPLAGKYKIAVWVTLVPPSESKPKAKWNSEPFGQDYIKWSEEVAKLSVKYPNLVALSIDDFVQNLGTYTPEYLGKMNQEIDRINPDLNFIPCAYYKYITADFATKYGPLIDGILFPYRAESEGANLKNPNLVENEIVKIRSLFKKKLPVYIDVYLSAHSSLGATTPAYVRTVIRDGGKYADGVLIYTHPNPLKETEKYNIVKDEFLFLKNKKL